MAHEITAEDAAASTWDPSRPPVIGVVNGKDLYGYHVELVGALIDAERNLAGLLALAAEDYFRLVDWAPATVFARERVRLAETVVKNNAVSAGIDWES